jgi:hypothetical protein
MYYENDLLTQKLSAGSISFYPACDTLLHKADVKYMVCDDILYQVDHTLSKTMIARTETRTPARTVWLGLAVDDSLTDLENISFYLDFPNLTESYEYLFLLPCTEWSAGGTPIRMEPGIYETDEVGIRIENELECVDMGENQYGRHRQGGDGTLQQAFPAGFATGPPQ